MNYKYVSVTLVLMLLSAGAGFALDRYNPFTNKNNQSQLTGPKYSKLFSRVIAIGNIVTADNNSITLSDGQTTEKFPLSQMLLQQQTKPITANKNQAIVSLALVDNSYQVTSISYISDQKNTLSPPPASASSNQQKR